MRAHGLRDVLDPLLAQRLEAHGHLVSGLGGDHFGDADAPGLRQRLKTCRDVHAVAVDAPVVLLDDLPRVESDSEAHAAAFDNAFAPSLELGLNLDRRAKRVDHAAEHGENAIAGGIDHAPFSGGDTLAEYGASRAERGDRPRLVLAHQARIADGVRAEHHRKPAFGHDGRD